MTKIKKTPLSHIQESGKGRDYAWLFFVNSTTPSRLSKFLYKNIYDARKYKYKHNFNYYLIRDRFVEWKLKDYFDPIIIKTSRQGKSKSIYDYPITEYIFNLNPLYEYAEKFKVKFTEQEKKILEFICYFYSVRDYIYERYNKTDDFITGVIKFYVSFLIKLKLELETYDIKELQEEVKKHFKNKVLGIGDVDVVRFEDFKIVYPRDMTKNPIPDGVTLMTDRRMMVMDIMGIYTYYQEFHRELKNTMVNLDLKMLKLLGL